MSRKVWLHLKHYGLSKIQDTYRYTGYFDTVIFTLLSGDPKRV